MKTSTPVNLSALLDKVAIGYDKISTAPSNDYELCAKYGEVVPNFKAIEPEHREAAEERYITKLLQLRDKELDVLYKATDGVNVFLIQNPYVAPVRRGVMYRKKPVHWGFLTEGKEKKQEKFVNKSKDIHENDDDLI